MIYEAAIIRHDDPTLIVNEDISFQSFRDLILKFRYIYWNCHGEIRCINRDCIKNTYAALKANAKSDNTELKISIHWEGHTLPCPLKYNIHHTG